jgi:hypothetical protein
MKTTIKTSVAVAVALILGGCQGDFLTGSQLSNNPNIPQVATNSQLFIGIHANVFSVYTNVLSRNPAVLAQHFQGLNLLTALDQYIVTPASDEGVGQQLAGAGGLLDARRLQAAALASGDSIMLGMAQVQEALLMGMGADIWGDLVYTHALKNEPNPPLDDQLAVFDSLQVLLSRAIVNLGATGPTNAGPRTADVSFNGKAASWAAMAHSLKARFYMHNGEVRPTTAYASAEAEAALGIQTPAGNYNAVFGGNSGDQNPWGSFDLVVRAGYLIPGAVLDSMLVARNDPRRALYFKIVGGVATDIASARVTNTFPQPILTAAETHLTWAEAAYRVGDMATALAHLNVARSFVTGLSAEPAGLTGPALLQEILTEEYINDYQLGDEAWKLYRRTCYPNLANRSSGGTLPMPGRFFYETLDLQTNSSLPAAGVNPNGIRNTNDPQNTTADAVGGVCKAGA